MIEAEKQKIKKDFERKESQVEVQKKMCVPVAKGSRVRLWLSPSRACCPADSHWCMFAARSEYSKKLNEMRLKVLSSKQEGLSDILTLAEVKLAEAAKKGDYAETVKSLIVQVRATAS